MPSAKHPTNAKNAKSPKSPKNTRRVLIAAALLLGVSAGPTVLPATTATTATAATATADTASARSQSQAQSPPQADPDLAAAMEAAIAGLPSADATAALVRVGGARACGAAVRACTISPPAGPPIRTPASEPVP